MEMQKMLTIAGVPPTLHAQAAASIDLADKRSRGLLWAKLTTRLFRAGRIARAMQWQHARLTDARPDWADDDIAPMLNITGHGDNGPWRETPEGGRPYQDYWLNQDPASDEYKLAVSKCYWCPGNHPRSTKAREAWYRRNGGEYRAWARGELVDTQAGLTTWQGAQGKVSVTVCRSGDAWIVKVRRRVLGKLGIATRIGFEVDNVFQRIEGRPPAQVWYPLPGVELRAPVTWSVLPVWGD